MQQQRHGNHHRKLEIEGVAGRSRAGGSADDGIDVFLLPLPRHLADLWGFVYLVPC